MTKPTKIRILAIATSASPGFAVVDIRAGKPQIIALESVKTDAKSADSRRYAYIEAMTVKLAHEYGPFDYVTREHFTKGGSKRSTQLVFGSWAAVDAALGRYGYAIQASDEVTPSAVKKEVGGSGKAEKGEVAEGVRKLYGLPADNAFKSNDESDAAAIAWTFAQMKGLIG